MNAATASPKRRMVTSVDLGDLRPHVERASASAGVGPSTWLRELVERELGNRAGQVPEASVPEYGVGADRSLVYRAWLNAALTAKLDERRRRDGFRSRAAVLRALIDGVGMTPSDDIGAGPQGMRTVGRGVSLREAVEALGASNYQLVAIGRNINQIAKTIRAVQGRTTATDRWVLEDAVAAIHQHVGEASKLVGHLRPMLRRAD